METTWFILILLMLVTYIVLDGFGLGTGIILGVVSKTDLERRMVLRTIGPVWNGNEVWLIAAGGTLYFAFPLLYASSLSGFYLPLIMILWLLMLRAVGLEFRSHINIPAWKSLCDAVFSLSSMLLAVFLGAALGNVIRGVPLGSDGYFFQPLWTTWQLGRNPGILDWYTVLVGFMSLVALSAHGALYITTKTQGELNARARHVVLILWPVLFLLTCASLLATLYVRPPVLDNYKAHPISFLISFVVIICLAAMLVASRKGKDKLAFTVSCLYIVGMLAGAAWGLYPNVLPATTNPAYSLTVYNTAAGHYGLSVGLVWWPVGMILAFAYFVILYYLFRGKVKPDTGADGY